jgi:carbon storage regulator
MLVLRRKIGEEIRLGDGVVIKVLSVNGRAIRLGIEAPASVPIWRSECEGFKVRAQSPDPEEEPVLSEPRARASVAPTRRSRSRL